MIQSRVKASIARASVAGRHRAEAGTLMLTDLRRCSSTTPTTYRPPGGEKVVKGYIKDSFSDAWKRYLVVDTRAAPAQGPVERLHGNIIVNDREFRENRSVTLDRVLPLHNSENHSPSLQCYRVTDQHPRDRLAAAMVPDPNVEIGEAEGEL
jgi:hypothetical protein